MPVITVDRDELEEVTEEDEISDIRSESQQFNLIGRRVDVIVDVDDVDTGLYIGLEEAMTAGIDADVMYQGSGKLMVWKAPPIPGTKEARVGRCGIVSVATSSV